MTNNFSVLFKKYSVPVLLLVLGLTLLIVGVLNSQGTSFMLSSVLMFIAGGLSLLYSSGKMKTMFLVIFGVFGIFSRIIDKVNVDFYDGYPIFQYSWNTDHIHVFC